MKIRKYGFHGTSVKYVTKIAIEQLKRLGRLKCSSISSNGPIINDVNEQEENSRLIVAHLGNGASVTAVVDGKV